MEPVLARVWAECNPHAWRHNFCAISASVEPATVLPVLKANGYGLGARECAAQLRQSGVEYVAVSCLREALDLRDLGLSILIFGVPLPAEVPLMIERQFTATIPDLETARMLSDVALAAGRPARAHVKIDTGMGRLGIPVEDATDVVERIARLEGIEIEGIYSHLAAAGAHDKATQAQYEGLASLIAELAEHGVKFRYRHIANSAAIAGIPEACREPFNMVRSGLDLHGAHLSITPRAYNTMPVLEALKSRLMAVRSLPCGTTISYGRTYRVSKPDGELIGVVPIGYADGYPRGLSNLGEMLVRGRRCHVVGVVCMDFTMISLDDVPDARPGDEVVLIGRQRDQEVSLGDVARAAGTIPYDIICSLGARVQRRYL